LDSSRFSRAAGRGFVFLRRRGFLVACAMQRDETLTRRLPVPRLRTVLAAVDHQHAISGDAVGRQCEQPILHVGRE